MVVNGIEFSKPIEYLLIIELFSIFTYLYFLGSLAREFGKSAFTWNFLTFATGPLGIIVAFLMMTNNVQLARRGEIFNQYDEHNQPIIMVISRWILVLPLALLGLGLVMMIFEEILRSITLWHVLNEIIRNGITPFLMGAAYIYIGVNVAPTHHKIAAYCLITIFAINLGNSVYTEYFNNNDILQKDTTSNFIDDIFIIMGAVATTYVIFFVRGSKVSE